MRKDTVVVSGYLENGKLAYQQIISVYDWYEEDHPLVDSEKSRSFYKIAKIMVQQYNSELDDEIVWETNYHADGTLKDAWKHVNGQREPIVPPSKE